MKIDAQHLFEHPGKIAGRIGEIMCNGFQCEIFLIVLFDILGKLGGYVGAFVHTAFGGIGLDTVRGNEMKNFKSLLIRSRECSSSVGAASYSSCAKRWICLVTSGISGL